MVPQIKKILFASDLTENSRHAFHYAASMAVSFGGSIIILHVVERLPTGMRYRLAELGKDDTVQKLRAAQQQEVKNVLIGKKKDIVLIRQALAEYHGPTSSGADDPSFEPKNIIVEEGEVAEEILRVAAHHGCDLIVMGAHTGLLGATAIGSVTKTVLHRSRVPVLVVPPPPNG